MWDEDLISPVSLIAEPRLMKERGVQKMVKLPVPQLTEKYSDIHEFLFLVRPTLAMVEKIAEAIR